MRGAKVDSFDCDEQSVECARRLKRQYFKDDSDWKIESGVTLDKPDENLSFLRESDTSSLFSEQKEFVFQKET